MSFDEIARLADMRLSGGCRLFLPYEKQRQFFALGADHDVRCLSGGNRCMTPWSFIETPSGSAPCVEVWTSQVQRVVSWDGVSRYVAQSGGGLFLGIEQAFRVVLDNGEFFDCSRMHRVLTCAGWLSLDELVSLSSGRHCWHKREDYEANCVAGGYLCDPLLRPASSIGQALPLQQGDALQESRLVFDMPDEAERELERIRSCPDFDRLSSSDDLRRFAGLFALFSRSRQKSPFLSLRDCTEVETPLAQRSSSSFQLDSGPCLGQSSGLPFLSGQQQECSCASSMLKARDGLPEFHGLSEKGFAFPQGVSGFFDGGGRIATWVASRSPCLVGGRRIAAVVPIGLHPIIDAHVPVSNNYLAAGVVHHNTGKTLAVFAGELPYHLTGEYPDWWVGKRFNKPTTAWVGSTDWSTNVEGCQLRLLGNAAKGELGRATFDDATGQFIPTGIPADRIVRVVKQANVPDAIASATIRHTSGGLSRVRFFAYSKGREKLQAGKADIVALDEEPPEDIMTELMARTMDSRGITMLSFTPLLGMSPVVRRFVGDVQIDDKFPEVLISKLGALVRVRAHDAPHLGPDIIAKMYREYPKHEHMARIEGIPALGEGAVYPFTNEDLDCAAFIPPMHWKILDAVDFGFNHPTARARLIMDPDDNRLFMVSEYKLRQELPAVHAANWREKFQGRVPVIWPHDGRNTETDGTSKKAKYEKLKVRFTTSPAELPTGGNSLEGSVQLLFEAMASGKFKVFRGNGIVFHAERSMYRREKGPSGITKIKDGDDDLLDAVRYAAMGLLSGQGVTIGEAFATLVNDDPNKPGYLRRVVDDGPDDPLFS